MCVLEKKTRKIIPLLYEDDVVIPRALKIYTHLRYTEQTNALYNFWSRLIASIRIPATNIQTKRQTSTELRLSSVPVQTSVGQTPNKSAVVNKHCESLPNSANDSKCDDKTAVVATTEDENSECIKLPSPPEIMPIPETKQEKKWSMKHIQKVFKRKKKSLFAAENE